MNKLTKEEIIKEWKEKQFEWKETAHEIILAKKTKIIFIDKRDISYSCTGISTNFILFEEHQLLTKTFKVLETKNE